MDDRMKGWAFVAVQVALLGALILLPTGNDWSSDGWVRWVALAINLGGLAVLAIGAIGLGRSLTPTPVPLESGHLETGGIYAFVRHPIYTGVMMLVIGVALGSGSALRAGIAAVTIVFFNVKARWEERKLIEMYPEYPAYATVVSRFVPRIFPS